MAETVVARCSLGDVDANLPTPSDAARSALAPTGALRAAINLSNFLLVTGTAENGDPVGVSPDIAAALAAQLGVGLAITTFPNPGDVADAAPTDNWDIGNIGAEAKRAEVIDFSPPYCEIEATYLLPADSPHSNFADLDQPGIRIAVKARAAYCLRLEQDLKEATLVQVPNHDDAIATFLEQECDALAGLRPRMNTDLASVVGGRILDGHFATVQQAIGTPKGRDEAGSSYLREFVEAAKASGLVDELIAKHGQQDDLATAPPAKA